jgi:hypothetical protein
LRPALAGPLADRTQESMFLHLWNEVFRRANVIKTMLPPRGSLLREIADRHPVEGWRGEYDVEALEHLLSLQAELQLLRKEVAGLRKQRRSEPKTPEIELLRRKEIDAMRKKRKSIEPKKLAVSQTWRSKWAAAFELLKMLSHRWRGTSTAEIDGL